MGGSSVPGAGRSHQNLWLFTIAYTILVILWGAVVRATGSGAGCGAYWPKCDGQVIPEFDSFARIAEFSHRAMSGVWILLVAALAIAAFRRFAKGHLVRKAAVIVVIFGIIECLIGAALVVFRLVGNDTSATRAWVLVAHHTNTVILLGALTLGAYWAFGGRPVQLRHQGAVLVTLVLSLFGTLLSIVSGAIAALGGTLFPVANTLLAVQRSLDPSAHFLERLRIAHPIISVSASLFLVIGLTFVAKRRSDPQLQKFTNWTLSVLMIQLVFGLVNVAMEPNLEMSLVHLAIADTIWMLLVLTSAVALRPRVAERVGKDNEPARVQMTPRETVRAYVALTKPRVVSLLLFTTLAAMFIAARGWPGGWMLLWVGIGGYLMAGAANAINMVIDRDIDGLMKRTSQRPTLTGQIPSTHAMLFALVAGSASFTLLWIATNLVAAMLAFAGLLFYILIYTLLLKRRTWVNVVIGGAAGSFPPLVGWAAVTGELAPLAWFLFALIFVWTPVHFWALALLIKDDYAVAGVPMLPVVKGERATVLQITAYSMLTAMLCFIPVLMGQAGLTYLLASLFLNAVLVARAWQLMNQPDRPRAVRLFKYSMVYLALIFVVIAVDRAQGGSLSGLL